MEARQRRIQYAINHADEIEESYANGDVEELIRLTKECEAVQPRNYIVFYPDTRVGSILNGPELGTKDDDVAQEQIDAEGFVVYFKAQFKSTVSRRVSKANSIVYYQLLRSGQQFSNFTLDNLVSDTLTNLEPLDDDTLAMSSFALFNLLLPSEMELSTLLTKQSTLKYKQIAALFHRVFQRQWIPFLQAFPLDYEKTETVLRAKKEIDRMGKKNPRKRSLNISYAAFIKECEAIPVNRTNKESIKNVNIWNSINKAMQPLATYLPEEILTKNLAP